MLSVPLIADSVLMIRSNEQLLKREDLTTKVLQRAFGVVLGHSLLKKPTTQITTSFERSVKPHRRRYAEMTAEPSYKTIQDNQFAAPKPSIEASIRLTNVTKEFGDKSVLQDLNLHVDPGDFLAFVGPSGAGKSTLLRLLNGGHTPTSGRVEILGTVPASCNRPKLRALRARIGFVFQQFGLVGRLTSMENVLMGTLGRLTLPRYGISTYPKDLREKALENLERVGLRSEERRVGKESGARSVRR